MCGSGPQLSGQHVATRILTDDQLADCRRWFDNHRRLRELVTELEELSLAMAEAVTGAVRWEGFRPARVSPDAKPRPSQLKAVDTDGHS